MFTTLHNYRDSQLGSVERICLPCKRQKRCKFNPWVRKIPWRRNGSPLQYPCLENPMDRGTLQATVHGVSKSWMWLSMYTHTHTHTHTLIVHLLLLSCSVMSDYFWPHGLQHARLPCPSPSPGDCLNSCPSSQWCHPTISSSVIPSSSCLQSFPASGSFPTSQFFASGGQSIGASASESVLPKNIQDRFSLGWTGWISLPSKGLLRVFSNTTVQNHQFFDTQLSL